MNRFKNRKDAGERLVRELSEYHNEQDIVVLGLPRGGVPVAAPVARALKAPLGVFVVRKVGVPGHRELAMGAIASGGVRVVNESVMQATGTTEAEFEAVAAEEQKLLAERERAYRGEQPALDLAGKTVILVDDGIATGATARVAIKAIRQHAPRRLVVAVPVAPPDTCHELAREADDLVCPLRPLNFAAVSQWYEEFGQTSDKEVRTLLHAGRDVP